ncbi:MAG TPA: TonB C-terminal domain-containing protein [Blastocatellia bacterium]
MSENTRLKDDTPIFHQITDQPLLIRLARELKGAIQQIVRDPASFLRVALLPANRAQWFPVRVLRVTAEGLSAVVSHPISFLRDAFALDTLGKTRRRRLLPVLMVAALLYGAFGLFAIYEAFLSPIAKIRIVENYNYEHFHADWAMTKLVYPPGMLHASNGPTMTIEEIRKLDAERKRKAELAKIDREKRVKEEEARRAEEEKKEADAAAKKEADAKAAEAKAAEAKAAADKSKSFGEINIGPIKDIVGNLYNLYQSGQLTLADNFKIMLAFRIDPDGSIPRSSVRLVTSSGSKKVDENAMEILGALGASHALGPLSSLSSNTIELDVNDQFTRLSITSFAPTAEEAAQKAYSIGWMLKIVRASQAKKNPAVAELLSHLVIKADNKRVDADMTVPKSRATEMMKTTFSKPSDQAQE